MTISTLLTTNRERLSRSKGGAHLRKAPKKTALCRSKTWVKFSRCSSKSKQICNLLTTIVHFLGLRTAIRLSKSLKS